MGTFEEVRGLSGGPFFIRSRGGARSDVEGIASFLIVVIFRGRAEEFFGGSIFLIRRSLGGGKRGCVCVFSFSLFREQFRKCSRPLRRMQCVFSPT